MTLPLDHQQKETLANLKNAASEVRFVLIGATALKIHLPLPRPTDDIDLVIVASLPDLAEALLRLGWRRDDRQKQRWLDSNGVIVDVLPGDNATLARGRLTLEGDAKEMNIVGFELALQHTVKVDLGVHDVVVEVA